VVKVLHIMNVITESTEQTPTQGIRESVARQPALHACVRVCPCPSSLSHGVVCAIADAAGRGTRMPPPRVRRPAWGEVRSLSRPPRRQRRAQRGSKSSTAARHADTQSPLSRVQRASMLLASVLSGKRSRFCACCLFTAGLGGQPHSLQIKMFASSHTLLHRLQPKRKHQPMGPRTAMRHHLALCAAALCKCVRVVNISEWFPKLKTHATRAIG
jgi:hypothetical protein